MNYRHIFHAGNFADVVKHAVLALVIEHLKLKDAPFRVIDTHAGIGSYDLDSEAALKTGEWQGGIGRLLGPGAEPIPSQPAQLLEPYLAIVRALNPPGALRRYPGSPRIARALLRPQDQLVVNELHPDDAAQLRAEFRRDTQTKVLSLDGWTALKSLLPPKERRGVVLVDPPFEEAGELDRIVEGLVEARRRFATGIYLVWYPIKDLKAIDRLHRQLAAEKAIKLLKADFMLRTQNEMNRLNGCGLLLVNPPYRMDERLGIVLSFLGERLSPSRAERPVAAADVAWLSSK